MSPASPELVIRPFVKGRDEDIVLELANAHFERYYGREVEPLDEDDLEWMERSPWWRDSRMWIAELSGRPVGLALAYLDRARELPRGYVRWLITEPGLEGSEVARALLKHALSWLSAGGARTVHAYARDNMEAHIRLYRSMGFRQVRSFSIMRLRPDELPGDLRPCREVVLRPADPLGSEEDLRTLNALYNEAFSEHFDFRPETLEETRSWFEHEGYEDHVVFAFLEGRPVGYVVASVSTDIAELEFKRGIISSIGVLKPYRRRGIGTALMLEAMRWLTSKGAEVVELGVDDENPTGAPAFYARLGFKRAYRHLTFEKELLR